ncbi:MAG: hypothetical protein C0498_00710 [Anaerolinea sp.]|jgi:DNA-binding Xre family transcriptional regulator|nr:hypothetical protein [Anaerolinea sp.]
MSPWGDLDKDEASALGRVIIGAGIRAGRIRLGMTQVELSLWVGVSQSVISRLETGTTQGVRFRTLARIVGVMEACPGFVFPDGPPPPTRGRSAPRT